MYDFPELEGVINPDSFEEYPAFDPTYRSDLTSGYEVTRKRATFVPREWRFIVSCLTDNDKANLELLERNVDYGADIFIWYYKRANKSYYVRFVQILKFKYEPNSISLWRAEIVLRQAQPEAIEGMYKKTCQHHLISIENLAAGADISDRLILGFDAEAILLSVYLLVQGTPAGIDDDNKVDMTLKNAEGETVITKTYNAANQPPTNNFESLGTVLITDFEEGDFLKLSMTCGATANMPPFILQIKTMEAFVME